MQSKVEVKFAGRNCRSEKKVGARGSAAGHASSCGARMERQHHRAACVVGLRVGLLLALVVGGHSDTGKCSCYDHIPKASGCVCKWWASGGDGDGTCSGCCNGHSASTTPICGPNITDARLVDSVKVSGAGTTEWNSEFRKGSLYGDCPLYQRVLASGDLGSDYRIYGGGTNGRWCMDVRGSARQYCAPTCSASECCLPANGWSNLPATGADNGGPGALPLPTVKALSTTAAPHSHTPHSHTPHSHTPHSHHPHHPHSPRSSKVFTSRAQLLTARDSWCSDPASAATTHGPIAEWDISQLTDLSFVFCAAEGTSFYSDNGCNPKCAAFNSPLDGWDVSNVVTLRYTFFRARAFNQSLARWSMTSLRSLEQTFNGASSLNQPLPWVTTQLTNMKATFAYASAFNQALSSWDVTKVTTFWSAFLAADALSDCNKARIYARFSANPAFSCSAGGDCGDYGGWSTLCAGSASHTSPTGFPPPPSPSRFSPSPSSPALTGTPPSPSVPGHVTVTTATELQHALSAQSQATTISLSPLGSPYVVDGTLALRRTVTIISSGGVSGGMSGGMSGGGVTLRRNTQGELLSVEYGAVVMLRGLHLTGRGARVLRNAGTLTIDRCTVEDGEADVGAGIFNLATGRLAVRDSVVRANTAFIAGGGIASEGALELIRSNVTQNSAARRGGGLLCSRACTAKLVDSRLEANVAWVGAGGFLGGHTHASLNGTLVIDNAWVDGARGEDGGGNANGDVALRARHLRERGDGPGTPGPALGAGVYVGATAQLLMSDSVLRANRAPDGSSAGLYTGGSSFYVLPAPRGHYVSGAAICEPILCVDDDDSAVSADGTDAQMVPCEGSARSCEQAGLEGRYFAHMPRGAVESVSLPPECAPGAVIASDPHDPTTQLSHQCAGVCPIGANCEGSHQRACPPGSYCIDGIARSCPYGTFSEDSRRTACTACPSGSTTPSRGSAHQSACESHCPLGATLVLNADANTPAGCECDVGRLTLYLDGSSGGARYACTECHGTLDGADCTTRGEHLADVPTKRGFWRPSATALNFSRCPYDTCIGGSMLQAATYHPANSYSCKTGTNGAWCAQCHDSSVYFDEEAQACLACAEELPVGIGLLIAIVAAIVGIYCFGPSLWRRVARRLPQQSGALTAAARRVRLVCACFSLRAKFKILFTFYQIVAQIGDVYQVHYTGAYRSVAAALSIFKLKVLSWLPGLHGKCLFLPTLADELWFFLLTPVALSLICLAFSYARKASFVPAYPYVLGITFLVFPAISSRGFR